MITYMSDIICVTNRKLCQGDFLTRIEEIAQQRPDVIILREKDLPEPEYTILAKKVMEICQRYGVICILHSFVNSAIQLNAECIHLPMPLLRQNAGQKYPLIGTSCHSVEEAQEAELLGANYIIAGHIFDTDCKKGLPGRGIEFLREVCRSVSIPVYAIGGINETNIKQIYPTGAKGVCLMSSLMQCENVQTYIKNFDLYRKDKC